MGRRRRKPPKPYPYPLPKVEYVYNSAYSLEVKPSRITNGGLGVFTMEEIPANVALGEYCGEKRHKSEPTDGSYSLSLESDYYIDAFEYPRCVLAMINDSRFSEYGYNCAFEVGTERAEVWSTKAIACGEELYLDYGDDYWKHR